MKNFAVFSFFGKEDVVKDIVKYCVNNPNDLDFGEKLDISYRKLEFDFAFVSVAINYKDYNTLCDFKDVAKLIKEV